MASLAVRLVIRPIRALGLYVLLMGQTFSWLPNFRNYWSRWFDQMVRIGIDSIPIVALSAAFSGGVTTVQTSYQLVNPLVPVTVIGSIVTSSMILELAALITGFILAGRVGARIAAELGTMRVSEQIDALEAMGLNSVGYLLLPRILAGLVMFPVLYVFACAVGIAGGLFLSYTGGFITVDEFLVGARGFFKPFSAWFGLIKAITFGFIITSISCYKGYYTGSGAEGVGNSTTEAAVTSCVFILLADLMLATLLL